MNIEEFALLVPDLATMKHVDKIKHFAWFVQTQQQQSKFTAVDIQQCYDKLHYASPTNLRNLLKQMAAKRPPDLLRDNSGYRIEGRCKEELDKKYGQRQATIVVDAMLQSLPGKISDQAERIFLSEALVCYRHEPFRATIVMTWNLALDHLLNWILANHLLAFNGAISARYPKRAGIVMNKKDDFDEFKESEVIEVCGKAGIINDNTKRILNDKLTRRNMAAHPSTVEITRYQAEDVISDLVNNVILKLS
jgi:hypothetical protein